MYFKNPKFILRPDFCNQCVRANCAPKLFSPKLLELSFGKKVHLKTDFPLKKLQGRDTLYIKR